MSYLVMGNWKLNGNKEMVNTVFSELKSAISDNKNVKVSIAPPLMYLAKAQKLSEGSFIQIGAQNVDLDLSGAHTGDISATMLKEFDVNYVIIGHSERRAFHKESNEFIAKKFKVLKDNNLVPVLCIGETLEENESGKAKDVCKSQIDAVINYAGIEAFENAVIAYEPIWAIGTGKSATPEQAQEIHAFIRSHVASYNADIAKKVTILYGGSVNGANALEIFACEDIDGALVGGASLKAQDFAKIINAAIEQK
ncbi:MAG: triose-phosphate isomerase [Psittacicella sp.]